MNIVVAGGRSKADFLIEALLKKNHHVVSINDGYEYCNYLANKYGISVIEGNASKSDVLDEANIQYFDVIIALRPDDAENLTICQMASRLYHIKKTICTVQNPRNVGLFRILGVTNVISGTYMVANILEKATSLDYLEESLDLEDGDIVVSEISIKKEYPVCGEMIKTLDLPENAIIGCIIRKKGMVIPNGSETLQQFDKLLIISSKQVQNEVLQKIVGGEW
nr:TrkA family potassium uptake protein [uncultured Sellimonas sp.]